MKYVVTIEERLRYRIKVEAQHDGKAGDKAIELWYRGEADVHDSLVEVVAVRMLKEK
jgi:hypothetical protein